MKTSMKTPQARPSRLVRWGKVLLLSAPLLTSCAKDSNAESAQNGDSVKGTLVASNAGDKSAGDKSVNNEADMKEVILNVFGMN